MWKLAAREKDFLDSLSRNGLESGHETTTLYDKKLTGFLPRGRSLLGMRLYKLRQ